MFAIVYINIIFIVLSFYHNIFRFVHVVFFFFPLASLTTALPSTYDCQKRFSGSNLKFYTLKCSLKHALTHI